MREANESLRRQVKEGTCHFDSKFCKEEVSSESKTTTAKSSTKSSQSRSVMYCERSVPNSQGSYQCDLFVRVAFDEKCKDAHLPRETMERISIKSTDCVSSSWSTPRPSSRQLTCMLRRTRRRRVQMYH